MEYGWIWVINMSLPTRTLNVNYPSKTIHVPALASSLQIDITASPIYGDYTFWQGGRAIQPSPLEVKGGA
jgi:hypothetical protein